MIFQIFPYRLGDSDRVSKRITAGDHKIIAEPRDLGNIQDNDLFGLLRLGGPGNTLR